MFEFKVKFADLVIGAKTIHDFSYRLCKDYLTDEEPDFFVETNDSLIDKEIEISPYNPSRPYAESICLYREIAEALPKYDRCVFHGASIEFGGNGYIFTAVSGTGKTTHIKLWQKYLGKDRVQIVNGDKPILHLSEDASTVYSTPYAGKENYQNHSSAPLKAICVIRRGEVNKIERATPSDVLSEVIKQVYRPTNTEGAIKTLELLDRLLKLPVYVLYCDISEQAVKTSFEALTQLNFDDEKI